MLSVNRACKARRSSDSKVMSRASATRIAISGCMEKICVESGSYLACQIRVSSETRMIWARMRAWSVESERSQYTVPSTTYSTPSSSAISGSVLSTFPYRRVLVREITPKPCTMASRAVISSVMPSAKYSNSSLPRFSKGRTASILRPEVSSPVSRYSIASHVRRIATNRPSAIVRPLPALSRGRAATGDTSLRHNVRSLRTSSAD